MRVVVFSLFFFSRRLPFSMRCCVCVVFSLSLTSSLSSFFLSFFLSFVGRIRGGGVAAPSHWNSSRGGEGVSFLSTLFIYLFISFFLSLFLPPHFFFFFASSSSLIVLLFIFFFLPWPGPLIPLEWLFTGFFSLPSLPSFFLHGSNEHRKHPGFMGFNWFTSKCFFVCQQLTGFDWVWLGFTGFYWVLLG